MDSGLELALGPGMDQGLDTHIMDTVMNSNMVMVMGIDMAQNIMIESTDIRNTGDHQALPHPVRLLQAQDRTKEGE